MNNFTPKGRERKGRGGEREKGGGEGGREGKREEGRREESGKRGDEKGRGGKGRRDNLTWNQWGH